jgi:hypothetical protein
MATVPGDPNELRADGGIPAELQPTQGDLLMAAAIMHQQGKFQVAGDVVPFKKPPLDLTGDPKQLDEFNKMMTRDTLSRALGGGAKVLPMTPGKQSMQFDPLDPKDDDDDVKPPLPKPRPKKEKT